MMKTKYKFDIWSIVSVVLFFLFMLFLIYPLFGIMKQSLVDANGKLSLAQFSKFFSQKYYTNTISNSVKVTVAVTLCSLLVGTPMSYFYSFYKLFAVFSIQALYILLLRL